MGMDFLRFEGGKLAEDWVIWDGMSMMQQLGMVPER
jgi:predicted ester cyclase